MLRGASRLGAEHRVPSGFVRIGPSSGGGVVEYATSKHAVVVVTLQIALDYAQHNIRVNALCPGWVDTPFMKQMGGRKQLECYVNQQIPMARWADAEEIAEAALFLASDRSSSMTGQASVIDGGEYLQQRLDEPT